MRSSSGPTCSTSICLPADSSRSPAGWSPSPRSRVLGSVTSAPVPGAAAALWAAAEPSVQSRCHRLTRRTSRSRRRALGRCHRPNPPYRGRSHDDIVIGLNRAGPIPLGGATTVLHIVPGAIHALRGAGHTRGRRRTGARLVCGTTWPGQSSRFPESVRVMMSGGNKPGRLEALTERLVVADP